MSSTAAKPDNKPTRSPIVLAIVPAVLLVMSFSFSSMRGPYYLGYNYDPSYIYLLNSLNVAVLEAPGYADHPGTPVQILGAAVIRWKCWTACLTGDCLPVDISVLGDPERYQRAISAAMAVLIAAAALWAGYRIRAAAGRLLPAIVFQAGLLLFVQVVRVLGEVSPEPMLVFTGLLLAGVLAPRLLRDESIQTLRPQEIGTGLLTGAVLGLGIATKVTFAPLLGIILLFRGWRSRAVVLIGCGASFLLLTLPILASYPRMLGWFFRLAAREGQYGGGSVQLLPGPGALLEGVLSLLRAEPFLLLAIAWILGNVIFLVRSGPGRALPGRSGLVRFSLVACAILGVQFLITVKRPVPRYVLPAILLLPLVLAVTASFHQRLRAQGSSGRLALSGGLLLAVVGAVLATSELRQTGREWHAYRLETDEFVRTIRSMDECRPIVYYRASGIPPALSFGDGYVNQRNGRLLREMYPDAILYDLWSRNFHSMGKGMPRSEIESLLNAPECVLLYGASLEGQYRELGVGLDLEPVRVRPAQAIYRLRGLKE